jgi:succinate dehydrogenase / fumarate reductase cytochrome b subunit
MWLINSSVGRKFIMGISGGFLVLFLLFHATMNVVVLFSAEAYNAICEFLGANWYALAGTLVLAGAVVIHFLYATLLTLQNMKARGKQRYAVSASQKSVSWSSKNMFILGLTILAFLLLHLYMFWAKMQFVELTGLGNEELAADGAYWIQYYFSQPVYVGIYVVLLACLWLHLTHGVWSALQSLGLDNNKWFPRIKVIGNIVATIVVAMFMAVPVGFLIKTLI